MQYAITIKSCRKDTHFTMSLSTAEARTVQFLAKKSQEASHSECEPTLFIEELKTLRPEEEKPDDNLHLQ